MFSLFRSHLLFLTITPPHTFFTFIIIIIRKKAGLDVLMMDNNATVNETQRVQKKGQVLLARISAVKKRSVKNNRKIRKPESSRIDSETNKSLVDIELTRNTKKERILAIKKHFSQQLQQMNQRPKAGLKAFRGEAGAASSIILELPQKNKKALANTDTDNSYKRQNQQHQHHRVEGIDTIMEDNENDEEHEHVLNNDRAAGSSHNVKQQSDFNVFTADNSNVEVLGSNFYEADKSELFNPSFTMLLDELDQSHQAHLKQLATHVREQKEKSKDVASANDNTKPNSDTMSGLGDPSDLYWQEHPIDKSPEVLPSKRAKKEEASNMCESILSENFNTSLQS